MSDLMSSIKSLPIYSIVDDTLRKLIRNNNRNSEVGEDDLVATSSVIPTDRIGRTNSSRAVVCEGADCQANSPEVTDVGPSEFATMFLLSWPFDDNDGNESESTTNNLRAYIEGALDMPLPPILQQEIAMLRHQLRQIKSMFLN